MANDPKFDVFRIYEQLRKRAFGVSDATKPPEGFIFSFLPTGLPINPDDYLDPWKPDLNVTGAPGAAPAAGGAPDQALLAKISKRQTNLLNLSLFVDKKLQLNGTGLAVPSSTKISQTWKLILDGANAVPLPEVTDPLLKKSLDVATRLLMKPDPDDAESVIETGTYTRYKDCRKKYFKAIQGYTAQYQAAAMNPVALQTWPVIGPTFKADVDSAWDDWINLGKKDQVENALNLLGSQGTDAATAAIAGAKKKFERWQVAAGMIADTVPYVQVMPSNWCDPNVDHDGWTQYGFEQTDTVEETSTEATAWAVKASVGFGFWHADASAGGSSEKQMRDYTSNKLGISMKYALVDIERPWLNTVLLNLANWYLVGFKKNSISNGTPGQQSPLENEAFWLPAIPTQILVIKELKIKAENIHENMEKSKSHIEAGGSVGWGPFSVGGNYSHDKTHGKQTFHQDGEWLCVDGVQVVGWISQVLSASPHRDAPAIG